VRRAIDAAALRCVDQVVAVSRFTGNLFRRECPYGRPPLVIPNGVEQFFLESPAGCEPIQRDPRRLISVATLSGWQRKNIDGVIRAMALVGDRLDLEYWVMGDGADRPALEALTRDLHLEHRVRFAGRVSREELRAAYRSASLFVLVPRASPRDVEGFGLVYLEAAAAGTPSLGSRSGGIAEAISEGQSGFFAESASPDAIADALNRFFTGQVRFDPATVKAHAQRHTWPAAMARLEEVYVEVCSSRQPAGPQSVSAGAGRREAALSS
jgi:phosphatidyl-myo-inositol dimannoside synthase